MAIQTGSIISLDDIYNGFINDVFTPIASNCVDVNSIPYDSSSYGTYPMINSSRLGDLRTLTTSVEHILSGIGIRNGVIIAGQIAAYMTLTLQQLTKVGTWWYGRYYDNNGTQELKYQNSGKCLFNDSYIRSLSTLDIATMDPDDKGNRSIISARTITTYYSHLLNLWNSTSKGSTRKTIHTCHTNCHSDCHQNCHDDSGCYK